MHTQTGCLLQTVSRDGTKRAQVNKVGEIDDEKRNTQRLVHEQQRVKRDVSLLSSTFVSYHRQQLTLQQLTLLFVVDTAW